MYRKKNQLLEFGICIIDLLVALLSLILAGLIRYKTMKLLLHAEEIKVLVTFLIVIHFAAFYFLKVFDGFFRRNRWKELFLSIRYNLLVVVVAAFVGFAMKSEVFTSRLVMGYFLVINTLLIWLVHMLIRNSLKTVRRNKKTNVLVITSPDQLEQVLLSLKQSKEVNWNVIGVMMPGFTEAPEGFAGAAFIPDAGNACIEYATQHVCDEVFIQLRDVQEMELYLKDLILQFEQMGVVVNLGLELFDMGQIGTKQIYNLEQYPVIAYSSRLFDYRMVILKRLIDIVGAIVGLLITLVVGMILAPFLLIESPGPLVFKQNRVGVNGRIFKFYKFRSMYADAEERKKELMVQNEVKGLMFKMENDPRITKVGAFIRKTSIDELPQFWNVLKGDMSLVGTRPPTLDEYQQYNHYQKRRISFRPGITGLWQISGRSDIKDFDEVVKLDLEYIDNWSIWLDFKIILKTVLTIFTGSGAR